QALGGGAAARTQKTQKVVKKETDVLATKDTTRKALTVRPKYTTGVQDMRRQFEKQCRDVSRPQEKMSKALETKMKTQLTAKTNGSASKSPVTGNRFELAVTARDRINSH